LLNEVSIEYAAVGGVLVFVIVMVAVKMRAEEPSATATSTSLDLVLDDDAMAQQSRASSSSLPPSNKQHTCASTTILPIAIIGSSYAGLTYAHVLHRHSIPYTLFDVKSPPYTYVSGGTKFNIPSYEFIAKELDLEYSYQQNDEDRPTREDVIESFLARVRSNLITSRRVVKIECRGADSGCFYLHTISTYSAEGKQQSQQKSESAILYGPYQSVVGADGVNSTVRATALPGTFLIGDARWVNDRWYDLGLQRIDCGADIALIDGYELGQAMVMKSSNGSDISGGDLDTTITCKFSAYEISRRRTMRRLSILIVLLAIVMTKIQQRKSW